MLTLAVPSLAASAETITVCADGCDHTSINAAIATASDGDVIQLAAETYFEGEQIDTLGRAITLRGVLDKAGEPASVLDGAGAHRVLICQNGETSTTVFRDLVIQHGLVGGDFPENRGGGMYNDSSSPTLTDCNFCGNTSGTGNRNVAGDAIDGSSSGNLLLLNCNEGDVNFDLAIDAGDLGYLLSRWSASSVLNADINRDGEVNGADLGLILDHFGGATDATWAP
ncbi:MAG: hypothetical protein GWP75_09600 [Planctomycetia bacterium]|nr:hypothetical protein [Planctomycetia bacterium]